MKLTGFGRRGLVIALMVFAATSVGTGQQQAPAASLTGGALLDKFIGVFEGIAATGSAGFASLQSSLGDLMPLARQSLGDHRIDQTFFDRYTRILRVMVLAGMPDKGEILQPVISRECRSFIQDVTGKVPDASAGIGLFDLSAAVEKEIESLRKLGSGVMGGVPNSSAAAAGPGPYRVGNEVKQPERTKYVDPVYPTMARQAKIQGVVIVEATIGKDGKVISAKVLKPVPMLDEAALAAVKQWEYAPSTLGGVPIEVIMIVTVSFQLR